MADTPETTVTLSPDKIIKYLKIAEKQRTRAAQKFVEDYGPSSATVAEVNTEIAELNMAINRLMAQANTPIEKHIKNQK